MDFTISLCSGAMFGMALEKSGVTEKKVIQDQMLFKDQTMMKTFLSAAGSSAISFSVLQLLGAKFFKLRVTNTYVVANALGGSILGMGMYLGAGCPGTFITQIGAGKKNGLYGVAGGLFGALTYSLLSTYINKVIHGIGNFGKLTITKKENFWKYGLLFGSTLIGISYLIDKFKSSEEVEENSQNFKQVLTNRTWNQVCAGVVLGTLQIPVLFATNSSIGNATQYVQSSGIALSKVLPSILNNKAIGDPVGKSNVLLRIANSIGIGIGGFISSKASGKRDDNKDIDLLPKEKYLAFLGGFLALFGSRMAQGCNSGHGLSGMASGSISSFIATAATFFGGISTALIVSYLSKEPELLE